ncbi:MAG TPA: hypothetical protein VMV69_09035 [Pirellulales bacterium]|nr:hypothetical protein [Pirellulales bacterium]
MPPQEHRRKAVDAVGETRVVGVEQAFDGGVARDVGKAALDFFLRNAKPCHPAPMLSSGKGTVLPVFSEAAPRASLRFIEASALTRPLLRLAIGGPWTGSASDLLYAVETLIGRSGARHGGWPRDIARFGGYVRRLAPNLRSIGVSVVFDRETRSRRRRITLSVSDAVLAAAQGVSGASPLGEIQFGLFNPLS